ncbi:hypothetical protein H9P43_001493 [Blastocladiella emersonii ATCC 22665]|nr:hypothetical protein H9P43_001493 [Blastocladiella emersonii ATCC 22665]
MKSIILSSLAVAALASAQLATATTCPEGTRNLVANGDFEESILPRTWRVDKRNGGEAGFAAKTGSTDAADERVFALDATASSSATATLYHGPAHLTVGQSYTFVASARKPAADGAATITLSNNAGDTLFKEEVPAGADWTTVSHTFTPATGKHAVVIAVAAAGGSTVEVDAVGLCVAHDGARARRSTIVEEAACGENLVGHDGLAGWKVTNGHVVASKGDAQAPELARLGGASASVARSVTITPGQRYRVSGLVRGGAAKPTVAINGAQVETIVEAPLNGWKPFAAVFDADKQSTAVSVGVGGSGEVAALSVARIGCEQAGTDQNRARRAAAAHGEL